MAKEEEKIIESKKSDKVTVDKTMLEEILKRVEDQAAMMKALKEDNEMLKDVADKGRIATYLQKGEPGALTKKATVTVVNGKIVKSWECIKNTSYVTSLGVPVVEQITKLTFEDDSTEEMPIVTFSRIANTRVTGEVVEETKTKQGMMWKLRFEDGKELVINTVFINL